MRTLKRSECSVLPLVLKRKWYDMIETRLKCSEFREAKPFWETRIAHWINRVVAGKTPVLEFQNGYGRRVPHMAFVAGNGVDKFFTVLKAEDPVQHRELGEFPKDRYCLFIGERVELED